MSIPGFTAEASLSKTSELYKLTTKWDSNTCEEVIVRQ
jgi:hypothetical protein